MTKKKKLAAILLSCLPGALGYSAPTHAVHLNPHGRGQAWIYPYYGVNGGNQTIISVVNTANDVKAIRVRFLESRNSRSVIDFNLYLSPFDVWTGSVFALDANGGANLVTLDSSCTVPPIKGGTALPSVGGNRYVPFRNVQYTGAFADGGGGSLARTREGHVEIIEMGTLLGGRDAHLLADEATRGGEVVPPNCAALVAAWSSGGAWIGAGAAAGTNAPSGGFFGSGAVVDVANGTMLAYNADALDGFYFTGDPADDIHFRPVFEHPTLNNARSGSRTPPVTSFALTGGSAPSVVASSWIRTAPNDLAGVDAVSAALMVDAIYNEYTSDVSLGAATEWIVTFPTKRFYVDHVEFGGAASLAVGPVAGTRQSLPPFSGFGFTALSGGARVASFACEDLSITLTDRGAGIVWESQFGEILPNKLGLCEATNTVTFDQSGSESAILGTPSTRYRNLDGPFVSGSAHMRFTQSIGTGVEPDFIVARTATASDGDAYAGLPVTGFAAVSIVNRDAAPGMLANYAGVFRHRGTTAITPSETD